MLIVADRADAAAAAAAPEGLACGSGLKSKAEPTDTHTTTGHRLWNAAMVLGEMVDAGELDVRGKNCLELGAGAALPSLLAALVRMYAPARPALCMGQSLNQSTSQSVGQSINQSINQSISRSVNG